MVTSQNTFVRKFGDLAIVISVTDWKQFEDLMVHAEEGNDSPDFIIGSTLMRTIYSNMLPSMVLNTDSAQDITEETKGMGLAHILTSPYWSYRTVKDPLLGGLISEEKDIKIK